MRVPGFSFAGLAAGIKPSGKLDLALIRSDPAALVIGAFTTNRVCAAPVLVSRRNSRSGRCSAVIINSGVANACTGGRGMLDAVEMIRQVASRLKVPQREVLVCSTGKIGEPLPMDRVRRGIDRIIPRLRKDRAMQVAQAIRTTDAFEKISYRTGKIFGKKFHLLGIAKGAGMIEPHMKVEATLLTFFLTDLLLPRSVAVPIFRRSLGQSFNRISVDGDMSTNDTALFLASGQAGTRPLKGGSREAVLFEKILTEVMIELAGLVVQDGEGATKQVQVVVEGARNQREAQKIAYTIGNSLLVKTSLFGKDPNWGRVFAAAGRAGVPFNPDRTEILYEGVPVVRRGRPTSASFQTEAKRRMKAARFTITVRLHQGSVRHAIWTSDLGFNYVKLNALYRT